MPLLRRGGATRGDAYPPGSTAEDRRRMGEGDAGLFARRDWQRRGGQGLLAFGLAEDAGSAESAAGRAAAAGQSGAARTRVPEGHSACGWDGSVSARGDMVAAGGALMPDMFGLNLGDIDRLSYILSRYETVVERLQALKDVGRDLDEYARLRRALGL